MDRAVLEQARLWSWRRQRLDRTAHNVEDALRSIVAVPGEHPSCGLALLARVPRLLKGSVEGAVERRIGLRVPAMRGAVALVAADLAPAVMAAVRDPGAPHRPFLDPRKVDLLSYERLKRDVLALAERPVTEAEIRAAVEDAPEAFGKVLAAMCAEGVLLRATARSVRAGELTYVAARSWTGMPVPARDARESAAWLAGEFLRSCGPATAEDFVRWSGLKPTRAREALESHHPADLGGGLLLHRSDVRAFEYTRPLTGRVNLLPRRDPYPAAYTGDSRLRLGSAADVAAVYDGRGDPLPLVLVEGRIAGTWHVSYAFDRVRVRIDVGSRPGRALREALEGEARLVGTFLEGERVDVKWEPGTRAAPRKAAPARRSGAGVKRRTSARSGSTPRGSPRRRSR